MSRDHSEAANVQFVNHEFNLNAAMQFKQHRAHVTRQQGATIWDYYAGINPHPYNETLPLNLWDTTPDY